MMKGEVLLKFNFEVEDFLKLAWTLYCCSTSLSGTSEPRFTSIVLIGLFYRFEILLSNAKFLFERR